jgi:hypothetical protein
MPDWSVFINDTGLFIFKHSINVSIATGSCTYFLEHVTDKYSIMKKRQVASYSDIIVHHVTECPTS